MGGFIYSPPPADGPTDPDTFYARRARQQSAVMAAKREAAPVNVPSLSQIYADNQAEQQAQQQARRDEVASSPHAFVGQGMVSTPAQREAWKQEFFKEH